MSMRQGAVGVVVRAGSVAWDVFHCKLRPPEAILTVPDIVRYQQGDASVRRRCYNTLCGR